MKIQTQMIRAFLELLAIGSGPLIV